MTNNALELLAVEASAIGSKDVGFDGIRVLQHPAKFKRFLMGEGLEIEPVTVELWPALSCDARCPTCPFRISDARNEADATPTLQLMDRRLFQSILGSLREGGVQSVFLTGGGEPLLHPEIIEMAADLRQSGLSWAGFTNGGTLSADLARGLFLQRPAFFRVSLDAGNARLHRKIYGGAGEQFDKVVANVVAAGQEAARLGYRGFGVGFSLMPNVSELDLRDIRDILLRLNIDSGGGVSYASFRPRVIHYHSDKIVVPQAMAGQYAALAEAIDAIIIQPLVRSGIRMRFDHKYGAFVDSDREVPSSGGWGGAWITTIDHLGRGFTLTEMCGSSASEYVWGDLSDGRGFSYHWHSDRRKEAQMRIIEGEIGIPVANRFREIDAFLNNVIKQIPFPLDEREAAEMLEGVEAWPIHRSSRSEFI